jgi:hypothetical protein
MVTIAYLRAPGAEVAVNLDILGAIGEFAAP